MKQKRLHIIWMLLLFTALVWASSFGVKAQSISPEIKLLDVALWPEYDQPEVLVIYRVQLRADTALPTPLTFRLPDHIEALHAVAYEDSEGLININPDSIEWRSEGDDKLLTFPAPSTAIQFEYYDPIILSKQNLIRQLTFDFIAPYHIQTATFEVQEPWGSEDFSLAQEPYATINGRDGFQYNTIAVTDLAPDETFTLAATYWRESDTVSTESISSDIPPDSSELNVTAETIDLLVNPAPQSLSPAAANVSLNILDASVLSERGWFNLGYILLGAGVILVLGSGGYWWWSSYRGTIGPHVTSNKINRTQKVNTNKLEPPNKKEVQQAEAGVAAVPSTEMVALFCYQCGTSLQADANFCQACGVERRT